MEFIAGVESELADALDRAHDPARAGRRGGDGGLPALVGRAPRGRRARWSTCASTTRASTSSSGSGFRPSSSAGRSKTAHYQRFGTTKRQVVTEAVRYLAALGHTRVAHVTGRRRVRAHEQRIVRLRARGARARARGRDRRDRLQRGERRARDAQAPLLAGAVRRRSSSTATCSRSRASASHSRWASPCRTTCRSSAGTTR